MKQEQKTQIPLKQSQTLAEECAHSWVKTEIRGHKALKCKHCGKIIDSND